MAKVTYLALFFVTLAVTSAAENTNKDKNTTDDAGTLNKNMLRTNELMMKDLYYQVGSLRAEVTKQRFENENCRNQSEQWKNESAKLEAQIASLQNNSILSNSQLDILRSENAKLNDQIASLQNDSILSSNQIATLKNQTAQLNDKIASMQNASNQFNDQITSLQKDNAQLKTQIASLQTSVVATPKTQFWASTPDAWAHPFNFVSKQDWVFNELTLNINVVNATKLLLIFNGHAHGACFLLGFRVDGKSVGGCDSDEKRGMWGLCSGNTANLWAPATMTQYAEVTPGPHTITFFAAPAGEYGSDYSLNDPQVKVITLA